MKMLHGTDLLLPLFWNERCVGWPCISFRFIVTIFATLINATKGTRCSTRSFTGWSHTRQQRLLRFCLVLSSFFWSIETLFSLIKFGFLCDLLFLLFIQVFFTFGSLCILSISNCFLNSFFDFSIILSLEMFNIEMVVLIGIDLPLNILLEIFTFNIFPNSFEVFKRIKNKLNFIFSELSILAHGIKRNAELLFLRFELGRLKNRIVPFLFMILFSSLFLFFSFFSCDILIIFLLFFNCFVFFNNLRIVINGSIECRLKKTTLIFQLNSHIRPKSRNFIKVNFWLLNNFFNDQMLWIALLFIFLNDEGLNFFWLLPFLK